MNNDFNAIATFYDFLSRLVFKDRLLHAQCFCLDYIATNKKADMLILGGGTGDFLRVICQQFPRISITYVDASSRMLEITKRKLSREALSKVDLVCSKWENFDCPKSYDFIVTNFFLDCFTSHQLTAVIAKGLSCLKNGGYWCFTDFVDSHNKLKNGLIKVMYWFFRWTTKLNTTKLPDYDILLDNESLISLQVKYSLSGMIRSEVLEKQV